MKLRVTALLAAAVLVVALSVPAAAGKARNDRSSSPFVTDLTDRGFTVNGTVESAKGGSFVLRIDDHGHSIPFSLGRGVSAKPKAGDRVTVRYHPSGENGQVADEVNVH